MGYSNIATTTVGITECPWGTPTQAQWDEFHSMGDVDFDGYITQTDHDAIYAMYGWTGPPGSIPEDINSDGVVDTKDLTRCTFYLGWDICSWFARRGTVLTLNAPTLVEAEVPFVLDGYLRATDTDEPIPNAEITIYKDLGPGAFNLVTINTDVNGYYSTQDTLYLDETATYQSLFGGNPEFEGC